MMTHARPRKNSHHTGKGDSLATGELVHGVEVDGGVLLTLPAAQEHNTRHGRWHSALQRLHRRARNLRRTRRLCVDACACSNGKLYMDYGTGLLSEWARRRALERCHSNDGINNSFGVRDHALTRREISCLQASFHVSAVAHFSLPLLLNVRHVDNGTQIVWLAQVVLTNSLLS